MDYDADPVGPVKVSKYWFRRDLRVEDHTALSRSMESGFPVICLFIFDTLILDDLPPDDARISFIYNQLMSIHQQLVRKGSSMLIKKGDPVVVWQQLISEFEIESVHVNRDYEPYAIDRDRAVENLLMNSGIPLLSYKDQVIFEKDELLKKDGSPYTVFTPYKNKWIQAFMQKPAELRDSPHSENYYRHQPHFPSLEELGFIPSATLVPPYDLSVVSQYEASRNFPAEDATSRLSPHLRFGTVSIRKIIKSLTPADQSFLNELIWREFFMQILFHFPRVIHQNFKIKYNGIVWLNRQEEFESWCQGETGYAMVDAGMRQLNQTGFMHNRVRMITASFLCKHLLIDWRWGEAYFAKKLLDYELSSNNGNWQWAAGTGCDAAPYFRIFNPHEQLKKFDKNLQYVSKWLPEYGSEKYKSPIIDHRFARTRALQTYKSGLENYLPDNH